MNKSQSNKWHILSLLWFYLLKSELIFLETCYLCVFYIFTILMHVFVICKNYFHFLWVWRFMLSFNYFLLLCFCFKNLDLLDQQATVWFLSKHFICHFYLLWFKILSVIFTPSTIRCSNFFFSFYWFYFWLHVFHSL